MQFCNLCQIVKQRAVMDLNLDKRIVLEDGTTTRLQDVKYSKTGLLTTDLCAPTKDLTTHLDAYRPPVRGPRTKGISLHHC